MGQPIDLETIEVDYPPGYVESRLSANVARVRRWERDNRDRHLAAQRARYRAKNERTCKGVEGEFCPIVLTGTGKQRCTYHAYLQDQAVRRARRKRKAA
jgi:hypothetical protein